MEDDPARAREKREAEREEFFAQLDVDGVSEKETVLKEVVWEVLEQKGGTCRLNYIAADYRVKQKKTAFLPKSLNISVWIQRRMGDVMSVEPDPVAKDNQIVSFLDPSLVTAVSEAAAAAGTKQEQRTSSKSKGKGKTAEDEEYQAFFDNLPPSDFTFEEVTLMSAMLTRLEELGVNSARLNFVIQDHNVLQTKRALLPPSVKITHWISNRAASKFVLEPDPKALGNQILRIVDADGQPAVDAPEIADAPTVTAIENSAVASDMLKNRSSRDAFLQTLPLEEFTDDESSLLVAITTKVQAMGGRARLNEVSTDEKIKLAKKKLLPNGVGIKMWAESRATEHLSIEPDPVAQNNQIVSIEIGVSASRGDSRQASFCKAPCQETSWQGTPWHGAPWKAAPSHKPSSSTNRGKVKPKTCTAAKRAQKLRHKARIMLRLVRDACTMADTMADASKPLQGDSNLRFDDALRAIFAVAGPCEEEPFDAELHAAQPTNVEPLLTASHSSIFMAESSSDRHTCTPTAWLKAKQKPSDGDARLPSESEHHGGSDAASQRARRQMDVQRAKAKIVSATQKAIGRLENFHGSSVPAGVHEFLFTLKPYAASLVDLFKHTAVRASDLDSKFNEQLDYLHIKGQVKDVCEYLKHSLEGIPRGHVKNWRAYVYSLVRRYHPAHVVPSGGREGTTGERLEDARADEENDDADFLVALNTPGARQEYSGSDEEDGDADSLSDIPSLKQLAEALEVLQNEEYGDACCILGAAF